MNKQHIIDEIRRTAKANGGASLGKQTFEGETGIRQSEILKYWARWGDAVKEAGLVVNEMARKIDEVELLTSLAILTRKFGHFPVATELRLEVLRDTTMPSHTVFSRLGSKSQRVAKLSAFCRSSPEFQDVVPLLVSAVISADEKSSHHEVKTEECDGWVYMMKSGRHYKIGFSIDVGRRAKEIRTELPERMDEIHRIRTDDPSGIEAYWHNRFKEKRRNGEWFELTTADVRVFKKRKTM